jgi:hypothetical protein
MAALIRTHASYWTRVYVSLLSPRFSVSMPYERSLPSTVPDALDGAGWMEASLRKLS